MAETRSVEEVLARANELFARYDGGTAAGRGAAYRRYARDLRSVGRRFLNMGIALGALIVATIAFGLLVGPIGWTGLFLATMAAFILMFFFSVWPAEPKRMVYSDQLPNRTVVQQFDSYLVRQRRALPAPAGQRIDAISAKLPLLETRLAEVDALDPLAQDARRLMGKHLPELIERYERIPAAYRSERDGDGKTVDERLLSSLDAAREALDEIGSRLAKDDLSAFETQGRFIETRYKENPEFGSEQ